MFEDAFHLVDKFSDVFDALAELLMRSISEEAFVELLIDHGLEDLTPYESADDRLPSK